MSRTLEFKVFCLEVYKRANDISGADAVSLFKKHGVFDYISSFYDVLHSTGSQYIAQDIGKFLAAKIAESGN
ncbi:MAG: DUF3791 domain-containing protein [Chitinispirillales bacterium]|nr:DUF3791 domain-containing protein [Chitinispirillales bacterium]